MIPCIEYTRASTNNQEYSVGDQYKRIREWQAGTNTKLSAPTATMESPATMPQNVPTFFL